MFEADAGKWVTYADHAAALAKLQAFKDFVHARLDTAGVPVDPPRENADCRIGGRLDCVLSTTLPMCPSVPFELRSYGPYPMWAEGWMQGWKAARSNYSSESFNPLNHEQTK
jgi:hypothetical protein